ncbi:MAG: RNA methyltransferase [Rhodocyclaceae bacterium]|nr:RNA methyltransferase [Rhodocyclaceae bacterium]
MNRPNPLDRIRIVLSHPSHPGNIGAAARAMKTMGLTRLVLVNPRSFPDAEATSRAAAAADVLENARVCASLSQALEGTTLAYALTARRRDLATATRWPRQAAAELVAGAALGEVALVFGHETSGLSNEEVALCHAPVSIPTNPACSSLNLGAAVQVLCYELRLAAEEPGEAPSGTLTPASFEEVEGFLNHLEGAMVRNGFLDPEKPKRLMPRMRRLFARTRLEKEEVAILRGVLSALETGPYRPPSATGED